jgi:hypothetical protein
MVIATQIFPGRSSLTKMTKGDLEVYVSFSKVEDMKAEGWSMSPFVVTPPSNIQR